MLTKSHKNRPPIAKITSWQRNFNPSQLVEIPLLTFESINTRGIEKGLISPRTWHCMREESCRRFFFFFALVLTPRGYKEEKKAGNGGLGGWKMPGSHSTTASNPFLTPQHRRGGDERKQRAYTHTHIRRVQHLFKGIKGLGAMHETETELPPRD